MMEGVSYGCGGDACMGINPVENNVESTRRIADAVYSFICRNDIPTQLRVGSLPHMTTQMDAIRKGAPLSMIFSPSPAQRPPATFRREPPALHGGL